MIRISGAFNSKILHLFCNFDLFHLVDKKCFEKAGSFNGANQQTACCGAEAFF